MTQHAVGRSAAPATSRSTSREVSGWVGWIAFAGTLMVMLGTFHVIDGLVAIFNDKYYLATRSGLIISADYTAWGWVHMILGIVIVLAGVFVFTGQIWARTVGVAMALVSAVVNLGFLSAYPVWSVIMIALDVFVIMALTVHGSEVRSD